MNPLSLRLKTVSGTKDILPEEAFRKRELEASLAELFGKWGYREVQTPTIEYYQVMAVDDGPEDQLFKFIDREGHILALRSEFTTPIARLVATNFSAETLPLRLFYTGNVFRYENTQAGRHREFTQAGIELIGVQGVGADAEVIALAIEAMLTASLTNFKVGIGQVMVTKGLIEEFSHDPLDIQAIKQAIIKKNFVGLENILADKKWAGKPREELLGLATLHGSKDVLSIAKNLIKNERSLKAIEELEQLYDILESYGLADYLFFDFSILRDFDYYTGVVFEGYVPELGYPLCGGGRYDNLLSRFGFNQPAIGFAIGLERIMLAQKKVKQMPSIDYLVTGKSVKKVLTKAKELRSQGYSVEIDLAGRTAEQARSYASLKNIKEILVVGDDEKDGR